MEEFLGFLKRVCSKCEVLSEGIHTCEGNMEGKCDGYGITLECYYHE